MFGICYRGKNPSPVIANIQFTKCKQQLSCKEAAKNLQELQHVPEGVLLEGAVSHLPTEPLLVVQRQNLGKQGDVSLKQTRCKHGHATVRSRQGKFGTQRKQLEEAEESQHLQNQHLQCSYSEGASRIGTEEGLF